MLHNFSLLYWISLGKIHKILSLVFDLAKCNTHLKLMCTYSYFYIVEEVLFFFISIHMNIGVSQPERNMLDEKNQNLCNTPHSTHCFGPNGKYRARYKNTWHSQLRNYTKKLIQHPDAKSKSYLRTILFPLFKLSGIQSPYLNPIMIHSSSITLQW